MYLNPFCLAIAVSIFMLAIPSWAKPGDPLVFGSHADLRKLGIELVHFGLRGGKALPEKCGGYYGGDGGYDFTFSHEFVKKFRKRGFTNLSLCAAMESEIKYNPETGARLPSFILADIPAVRRGAIEAGTATDQIPLDVPDCFKNGLPLEDCKLNFDMMTGRRLTPQQLREYGRAGIEARKLAARAESDIVNIGTDEMVVAVIMHSRNLPKGWGYVLFNEAGPEPSNDTLKIVRRTIK
jgi:hypothetical protein